MTTQPAQHVGRPGEPARFGTTPEPLLRDLVGAILRRARTAQRRTLSDVAAEARVSTAYLSEVERGRKEASSEVLAAICAALGMRLADLVERAWADLALAAARADEEHRLRVLTSRARRARAGFAAPEHGAGPAATQLPGRGGRGTGAAPDAVLLAA